MLGRLRALWQRWHSGGSDPSRERQRESVEVRARVAPDVGEVSLARAAPTSAQTSAPTSGSSFSEVAVSRVIVGLGNPGPEYHSTRHNAGFLVIDRLAAKSTAAWSEAPALEARTAVVTLGGEQCLLVAPQTFMNRSGQAVAKVFEALPHLDPQADLLVVYDDMDLPTGRIRLRPSGGAGGHRGIGDIVSVLGTKAIDRLRFGVGHPGQAEAVLDWVLAPFPDEEQDLLEGALERAVDAIETAMARGIQTAMGQFNGIP